jgi:hypothetical protein
MKRKIPNVFPVDEHGSRAFIMETLDPENESGSKHSNKLEAEPRKFSMRFSNLV